MMSKQPYGFVLILAVSMLGCGSQDEGSSDAAGGAGPGAGGTLATGGASPTGSGGTSTTGTGGSTTPPTQGEPCGEGWGNDPIPGSVDLGLASNPEINAINNGSPDERAVFDQINAERMNAGLEPLGWSDQVANAARSHAADMNQLDYFDHGSSTRIYRDDAGNVNRDNWLPLPRVEFLYPGDFRRAGENIAMTRNPVDSAVGMWMDSDGHRAAILDDYGWTATHGAIGIDGSMVVFNPAQCAGE